MIKALNKCGKSLSNNKPAATFVCAVFAVTWQAAGMYYKYVPMVESIPVIQDENESLRKEVDELKAQMQIFLRSTSLTKLAMLETDVKHYKLQSKECGLKLNELYQQVAM